MMVDPVTGTVWGCRVYYDGRPCNCYSLGVCRVCNYEGVLW